MHVLLSLALLRQGRNQYTSPGTSTPVTLGDGALGSRKAPWGPPGPIFVSCPAVAGGEASEEVPHHLPHTHCLPDNTGVPLEHNAPPHNPPKGGTAEALRKQQAGLSLGGPTWVEGWRAQPTWVPRHRSPALLSSHPHVPPHPPRTCTRRPHLLESSGPLPRVLSTFPSSCLLICLGVSLTLGFSVSLCPPCPLPSSVIIWRVYELLDDAEVRVEGSVPSSHWMMI